MNPLELLADSLGGNLGMLKATISDFSDQDMLTRPTPAANNAIWQLGHMAVSDPWMFGTAGFPNAVPATPAEWAGKFDSDQAKNDDPAFFPKKDEVLSYMERARETLAKWVKTLTPLDLEKPMPDPIKGFAPTLGHLILMIPVHTAMHVGQLQVIRRKLGKPVLF